MSDSPNELISDEQLGEIPLEVGADLDAEVLEEFISEAREQLEQIEHATLALERDADNKEMVHTLFRAFHTLKGNAGFLDFTTISQLAHVLESLLDDVRKGQLRINAVITEVVLKTRDTLRKFVDEIEAQATGRKPRGPVDIPTAALKAAARFILSQKSETPVVPPSMVEGLAAPIIQVEESDAEQELPESDTSFVTGTVLTAVKVATNKLDGLVDLTGELLIAQSLVVQSLSSGETNRHTLSRNLDQLNRISKELQRTAMAMRMVPIRSTFQKMHRIVRDIAAEQGKNIYLVLDGEDTEMDRTIVEKLADPLMHMVRNAVDHAIEKPEQRNATGKPSVGTIMLSAYHKSGNIIIEVTDDGIGLDRQRIRDKAIKLGLLKPQDKPDDRELLGFILRPGFSTAETITSISGRGVGMDVVHKNISQLRGRIDIQSVPGQGTTFTLRLPLTLAIIDGLIVRVGQERYILPTLSVRESVDPRSCKITALPGEGEVVEMRKELIPLLRLRDHFQLKDAAPGNGIMVVIESDGKKRCLLADELVGKQEVVIKNLGEVLKTDPMVSGGAILGDGCVGLILDPAALVHLASTRNELELATCSVN
jgi:two-component system chemotaxis sensor kinase CheA